MTDRWDDLERVLRSPVDPLVAPPGRYAAIVAEVSRRRRRRRNLLLVAGAAVVAAVVPIVVVVPLSNTQDDAMVTRLPSSSGQPHVTPTTSPQSESPQETPAESRTASTGATAHGSPTARTGRPVVPPRICPNTAPANVTYVDAHLDMEGDGRSDAVGYADGKLVVKFSRGGSSAMPFSTASPFIAVLAVNADDVTADDELLVLTRGAVGDDGSVGQNAELVELNGCALTTATNVQGRPYTFEIGSAAGDTRRFGVGCVAGDLVGLVSRKQPSGDWAVDRTPVRVTAEGARNGRTQHLTLPSGSRGAALLREAACGDNRPTSIP